MQGEGKKWTAARMCDAGTDIRTEYSLRTMGRIVVSLKT